MQLIRRSFVMQYKSKTFLKISVIEPRQLVSCSSLFSSGAHLIKSQPFAYLKLPKTVTLTNSEGPECGTLAGSMLYV